MSDAGTAIIAYVRVSSKKQQVERQYDELADAVERHGLTVVRELTDKGISASLFGSKVRPDYEVLVALISSGQVDGQTVWVSEASRLSRDVEAFGRLRALCRAHRVRWWIKDREYDFTNNDDLADVTAMVTVAEKEVLTLSTRVRSGVRTQVRKGRPTGRTNFGYRRTRDPETGRVATQEADPITAPIVTEVATRYAGGESATAIARDLDARKVPTIGKVPWDRHGVVRVASNPTYLGKRRYGGRQPELMGKLHEGSWPALVDERTHAMAVARSVGSRKGYTPRKADSLLVGVAHCWRCPRGEKSPVGYIYSVVRDSKRVYRCLKGCVQLPQSEVDMLVEATLEELFAREDFAAVFAPGESVELAAARNRLAAANTAWDELIAAPMSPKAFAAKEPPLLKAISTAEADVLAYTQPSLPGVLIDAAADRRMGVFLALDSAVQRKVVARLLDITLSARGPAGRTQPVEKFIDVVTVTAR